MHVSYGRKALLARRLYQVFLLFSVVSLAGCPSRESVGSSAIAVLGPGIVNNPSNRSLRFDILKFGLDRFCLEMMRRGAPLKLNDDEPVLGRFFAESCQSQVLDDETRKSFVVQYSGKGYGWTNLTGRIGFRSAGLIEYSPDFQLHEGAMYVYFRPRKVDATSFQTLMVESSFARAGMALTRIDPDELGKRIVDSQLRRGFTVIRYDSDGETDFGLGIIPKGQKPFKPFQIQHSDKLMLANDRTEVHTAQQDFVGGFEITESDHALFVTLLADGAPAVDLFVVPKSVGDQMIERYVSSPGPAPLNAPALLDEPLAAGAMWKRFVEAPVGLYYVVIDHSGAVGRSAPPAGQGDRAAKIDYLVQVGEL
jgi:hypothetical protein